MMNIKTKTLRTKFLILLVGIPFLVLISVNVISVLLSYDEIVEEEKTFHQIENEKIAEKINVDFIERSKIVKDVSISKSLIDFVDNVETRDQDSALNKAYAKDFKKTLKNIIDSDPGILYLYTSAPTKFIYTYYNMDDLNSDYDATTRPWYKGAVENNNIYFSDPYLDDGAGGMMVSISHPVKVKNKVKGVVCIDITIDYINKYISSYDILDTGYMFLVTNDGKIVSHPNEDYLYTEENNLFIYQIDGGLGNAGKKLIDDEMLGLSEDTEDGSNDQSKWMRVKIDGRYKLVIFSNIKSANWYLGTVIDMGELLNEPMQDSIKSIFIKSLILIMIFIFIIIIIENIVVKDMKKLAVFTKNLGEGDFTKRLEVKSEDEMGQLSLSVNEFLGKVSEVIHSVRISSENFTEATKEIALGNQDLSQKTSKQSSTLQEMSSSISDILESLDRTTKQTETTKYQVYQVKEIMDDLDDSSKQMEEVVKIINDISFETNLLALNASIEAARAGQEGRGFEVVATEVKELSEHSASKSKEITEMIEQNIEKIDESKRVMDEVVEIITEISIFSKEQNMNIHQISLGINELNAVAQDNTALVEQSSATSEEIASRAGELNEKVKFFRLKGDEKELILLDTK